MSKQVLQMKYHPAKKEVVFNRFQSENEIQIPKDSKLWNYMNKRGNFVLQDHGNTFLSDIAETFDGEKIVNIEVITTKNDFEDFMQMIEFYNNSNPNIKIDATLLSELPDMEQTYNIVKEHGRTSIDILERHKVKIFDVPMGNSAVKKCIEIFSADIQKEIDNIKDKIEATTDNIVNLCFAGVYSAGKSALINSLLGYAILPEAIKSETAKMFRIQSPKMGENVRIIFQIRSFYSEIVWNENASVFEFAAGPTESSTRKTIQATINSNSGKFQHLQINGILNTLNTDEDVSSEIRVFFPIPLDSEKVQFSIYDTPGTDSNYGSHQRVLEDALSEQTHSILVFVIAPNKTEGEGNNALLNYLKRAEKKSSKNCIDISRSLFVMNWADSIGLKERQGLQTAEIKDKEDSNFSINLSDKKLFFTSAKVAYAAKAMKNGVHTDDEEFEIKKQDPSIRDPKYGRYYQQNRCATSEYATNRLIQASALALENAEIAQLDALYICSGVYALENEILNYGEKFAAAVRAFAIIDSVDKALSKMSTNAQSLERQNQEDITQINSEIEGLRSAMKGSINKAYAGNEISDNAPLPHNVILDLHLDSVYIKNNVTDPIKNFIDEKLEGRFFGLGEVRADEKQKREISQKIESNLDYYTRDFYDMREKLLSKQRDLFIETIKQIIRSSGNISDEAKNFVLSICPPEVKKPTKLTDFDEIYERNTREQKLLFIFKFNNLDKKSFIKDVDEKLTDIFTSLCKEFEKDYRQSLKSILGAVEAEFTQNIDKYSVLIRAKLEDKKAMERLRERILEATNDLKKSQRELEKLIWSVKNDG